MNNEIDDLFDRNVEEFETRKNIIDLTTSKDPLLDIAANYFKGILG